MKIEINGKEIELPHETILYLTPIFDKVEVGGKEELEGTIIPVKNFERLLIDEKVDPVKFLDDRIKGFESKKKNPERYACKVNNKPYSLAEHIDELDNSIETFNILLKYIIEEVN